MKIKFKKGDKCDGDKLFFLKPLGAAELKVWKFNSRKGKQRQVKVAADGKRSSGGFCNPFFDFRFVLIDVDKKRNNDQGGNEKECQAAADDKYPL